jgi:prepilin signal peptidase PulO-like enzyme (type II secretory pathway)
VPHPPAIPLPLVVAVWALVGIGLGAALRFANVWLARLEGLEPGRRRWQVAGPVLLTPVLFAALAWQLGAEPVLLIRSLWAVVLVQIIFFDAEHHLVLDRVLLPAGVAAIGLSLVTPGLTWLSALLAGAIAGLLFLLIAVVGSLVFRTEAMGLGDVKLAAFVGLVLGAAYTGPALLAGVISAGLVAILLVLFRLRGMRDAIAYGPFLASGALLGLFLAGGLGQ